MKNLCLKIQNEKALVGIIGLGYVGLPLSIAFSKVFRTIGYDINENYINGLMNYPIIVDCKNIFKNTDQLIYLGIGKNNI